MADHVSKAEMLALLDLIAAKTETLRREIANDYLTRDALREKQFELLKLQQRAALYH